MNTKETLYRKAFKKSKDGIVILNRDLIVECNPSARQLLQIKNTDFQHKSIFSYTTNTLVKNGTLIDIDAIVFHDIVNGFEGKMEWEFSGSKGNKIFVELIVSQFSVDDQPHSLIIIRDITDRKNFDLVLNARLSLLEMVPTVGLHELLKKAIDEIQLISGSQMAFLYLFEPNSGRFQLKSYCTGTDHPETNSSSKHLNLNLNEQDNYQAIMEKHLPIIHNSVRKNGKQPVLPQVNSCCIDNEMLVPIVRNRQILAALGVANKQSAYGFQDLKLIKTIGHIIWDLAEKKMFEEQLVHSQNMLSETQRFAQLGTWEYDLLEDHFSHNHILDELLEGKREVTKVNWPFILKKLVHPDDFKIVMNNFRSALSDQIPRQLEFRIITWKGHLRYITSSIFLIVSEYNKMSRIIGTIRDITEQENAVSELANSEKNFREFFNQSIVALFVFDNCGKIVKANSKACEMLSYNEDELTQLSHNDIHYSTLDNEIASQLWQNGNRKNGNYSIFLKTKQGKKIPTVSYMSIGKWDGQEVLFYVTRDMSEKFEAHNALNISDTWLKEITENIQEGIILTNMNFEYVFVNETFARMTGYSKEELLQMEIPQLVVYPDDFAQVQKLRNEIGPVNSRYVAMKRKDGSIFYINVAATQIAIGSEDFILGTQQDVTQEYEAHQRLLKAYSEINSLKTQLEQENLYLKSEITKHHGFDEIITHNKAFKNALNQVEIVAPTDAGVLIFGETGTGKELIARAIHKQSGRASKPMIKLNCAAIPESLIESELFGHEKGSFTGAFQQKIGRFEIAHGGTLFLDEIGEMPLELQSKLLRVLQEGEFERIGGNKTIKVDVRIISATNRVLEEDIEKGKFRRDLYYRLNVFPVQVPSLRERIDDIPLLTQYFVDRFNLKFNKSVSKIPVTVMNALLNYNWPGNIRELENLIERSVILSQNSTLDLSGWKFINSTDQTKQRFVSFEEMQRNYILEVLKHTSWRISGESGATKILGMKYSTLTSKMQKLGIDKSQNKL